MKVMDRILVITDLLLGAVYADGGAVGAEEDAVRALLGELLVTRGGPLPADVEARVAGFDPAAFDLARTAADFLHDPPMKKRRLLELVGKMVAADNEFTLDEDDYMRALGKALGMDPAEYQDLVLDYEIEELRRSFHELVERPTPPPPPRPSPAR